jgi:hypothetical protein
VEREGKNRERERERSIGKGEVLGWVSGLKFYLTKKRFGSIVTIALLYYVVKGFLASL